MATILCIDTDEQYARHVCSHLKNAGHTCIYTKSGDHAMPLVEKHGVDLLLCEVMLPDACGFEITRRIRAHAQYFMLPVVLMSSMSEEDEVKYGYAQGADVYLSKPIDPRLLTSCIDQKLAESAAASSVESTTGLYSSKRIKASVQRAITLHQGFVLVYIELTSVANFAKTCGAEARDKMLRRVARLIKSRGEQSGSEIFEAGHMGAGHFVCILDPTDATAFCNDVFEQWQTQLPKLLQSTKKLSGGSAGDAPTAGGVPDLSMMICATGSGVIGAHATNEYFDTLAQLRNKALASGSSGIFVDHRRKF